MSVITNPQFPLDVSGRATSNLITQELQALTGVAGRDYYFVLPNVAPFFGDSMIVKFKDLQENTFNLTEGVDYYLTHFFLGATRSVGKSIYGSITFLNKALKGTLILTYQTLGGEWTVDASKVAEILADRITNPRETTWDAVSGKPNIFPPIDHEWNLIDMVGMKDVVMSLDRLIDALTLRATDEITAHIHAQGNVHGLTAEMLGAVSMAQLTAKIQEAIQDASGTTDQLQEGSSNKFFTESRVRGTKMDDLDLTAAPTPPTAADTLILTLSKLLAMVNVNKTAISKAATAHRPQFTGLSSQGLVTTNLVANTPLALDISTSDAFQVNIKANGAIGFNISQVGDMSGKVVSFSLTTVNDSTGTAYAVAFPNTVKWVDGAAPPRSTSAGAKDYYYFVSEDNCTTWTGSLSNANPK